MARVTAPEDPSRTDERIHSCLSRLVPHLERTRVALTGGIAVDLHARASGRRRLAGPHGDVDLVAEAADAVSPTVTGDFLVSHYHLPQPGYPKFLVQLVDPCSRLRVDVFPDSLGALARARQHSVAGVSIRVLDPYGILDHKLATLARASQDHPVDAKHHRDALLLGELCGRPVPPTPAAYLRPDAYSQDVEAVCARCDASRSDRFPLAPRRQIHDILGYV